MQAAVTHCVRAPKNNSFWQLMSHSCWVLSGGLEPRGVLLDPLWPRCLPSVTPPRSLILSTPTQSNPRHIGFWIGWPYNIPSKLRHFWEWKGALLRIRASRFAMMWMEPEGIMLSEISQRKTIIIWSLWYEKFERQGERSWGVGSLGYGHWGEYVLWWVLWIV